MKDMKNGAARSQKGFTLIEIAIVLVIIGLLLGGVLQGQQLIENSRVKAAANALSGISAAIFAYQDRYGRLPGDDGDAAAFTARAGGWTGMTTVGDLNGVLGTGAAGLTAANTFVGAGENGGLFQHLRAAGFIDGNSAATGVAALPTGPFGGLIGVATALVMPAGAAGLAGNKLCMSNVPGSAALALDNQLDDGLSATGRMRATVGVAGANTAPGVAPAAYSEAAIYTICYRI